jgi:hypothetical protein
MSTELTIAYLTGSAKVTANHAYSDELIWRNRRTVGQMFFQPYESKEEFIFCARHTFTPMILIGMNLLYPSSLLGAPVLLGITAVVGAIGGLLNLCGNKSGASTCFDMATDLIKDLCQGLIDLVVLPLSLLVMLTRGVSTGLEAAGVCREQEGLPSNSF